MNYQDFITLSNIFKKNGFSLYLVGGTVRDLLLNIPNKDIDLASDATPNDIKSFYKDVDLSFKQFGSIRLLFNNEIIDVTTLRLEVYSKSRIPSMIKYIDDIKLDSNRRDFTINALYMDDENHIYDFHNGLKDLENKIIKMIGNPDLRFKEDPLRILRCLRFSLQLCFDIDETLKKSIKNNLHLLGLISYNLINQELDKMKKLSLCKFKEIIKEYELDKYIILDFDFKTELNIIDLSALNNELDNNYIFNLRKNNYLGKVINVNYNCDEVLSFIKDSPNVTLLVKTYDDILKCKSLKKVGIILKMNLDDLNQIDTLVFDDIKMIKIGKFEFDSKLLNVITRLNESNIIIDISNYIEENIMDIINLVKIPFISINIKDKFKDKAYNLIKEKKGIIHLSYANDFDGLIEKLKMIKSDGYLDIISLNANDYFMLKKKLLDNGFTNNDIDKLFYKNFIKVMKNYK